MNEEEKQKEGHFEWVRLFNHQWMVRNVRFFMFLAALTVLYIYNGHYSDKTIKDINKAGKEIQELQYEYKTIHSELMFRSKQSELAKAVEPLGLKELDAPPIILKDSLK